MPPPPLTRFASSSSDSDDTEDEAIVPQLQTVDSEAEDGIGQKGRKRAAAAGKVADAVQRAADGASPARLLGPLGCSAGWLFA